MGLGIAYRLGFGSCNKTLKLTVFPSLLFVVKNTTTKKLIQKLDHEVFVLNPVEPLKELPKAFEKKYQAKIRKDEDIEITIRKDMILNDAFSDLSAEKIDIGSIRNKSNRIEQLFIELTK